MGRKGCGRGGVAALGIREAPECVSKLAAAALQAPFLPIGHNWAIVEELWQGAEAGAALHPARGGIRTQVHGPGFCPCVPSSPFPALSQAPDMHGLPNSRLITPARTWGSGFPRVSRLLLCLLAETDKAWLYVAVGN